MTPDTDTLRSAALTYTGRGWAVIPLHHITDNGTCSCHSAPCATPGKHPIHSNWQHRGSTSAADIYEWWNQHPHANIGIVTGIASGIWTLDVDPAKGGLTSLISLIEEHGPMPPARKHETGSAGLHYIFRIPPGNTTIPTTAGTLGQGLDTRGDGNGMIVAPPSVSSTGAYSTITDTDPQDAPDWLLNRLTEINRRRQAGKNTTVITGAPIDINALPGKLRDRLATLDAKDRSAHFHGTVAACRRAGLNQAQTVTALAAWCDVIDKYRGRVEAEVARSWGKLEDADPANSAEAWLRDAADPSPPPPDPIRADLHDLIRAACAYQDIPDASHLVLTLAAAATRDVNDDPVWLLLVAPPSSGKTEAVRGLHLCVDAHLDDLTAAGLLSWKTGKTPHPTGILTRIGETALVTFGDLSTLLAASDRGMRDTAFALLRRVYDGHVVRDLGSAPEPLTWRGKVTIVGAVTGMIDNYAAHNDALGPRWVYYRMPARTADGKRRAAELARRGELAGLRETYAKKAAQVVYAARSNIKAVVIPEALYIAAEDAAIVTCWGRAAVPRHGYGRREIDGIPIVEEPPRLVKQLLGITRALLALHCTEEVTAALVRRVALDSMPLSRSAILRVLSRTDRDMSTSAVARAAGIDRHVARRNLEEMELVGVVRGERAGEEPDDYEPDRRACHWTLDGDDGALVAAVFEQAAKDDAEGGPKSSLTPPSPPNKKEQYGEAPYTSGHPSVQVTRPQPAPGDDQ